MNLFDLTWVVSLIGLAAAGVGVLAYLTVQHGEVAELKERVEDLERLARDSLQHANRLERRINGLEDENH